MSIRIVEKNRNKNIIFNIQQIFLQVLFTFIYPWNYFKLAKKFTGTDAGNRVELLGRSSKKRSESCL